MLDRGKFCPALWFSGFFALGALAHLIRFVFGFSIVVGGFEIPRQASAVIALVLGTLSAWLLCVGCSKPCCEKEKGS